MHYFGCGLIMVEKSDRIPIVDLLVTLLLMQPKDCAASAHCWLMSSLSSTSTFKTFSTRLLSLFIPQCVLTMGVGLTQVQHLVLVLVKPHEVPMAHLPDLVQVALDGIPSFKCVNCTTQLGVICRFTEGALDLSMSLMKIINNAGPNTDPRGTPLVTDVHQDSEPLTTILWTYHTALDVCVQEQLKSL
ncbi:hypothetical protein WISP_108598 [Willisornis vidua]|uniref:Uncharacterized protein n=1 Tax=Willisornis vidua TaxID=1566151 RepID=A0ABQ9D1H4_9PASS|nr:hypothetical protein WISP_108598 [Willisornis vidua]